MLCRLIPTHHESQIIQINFSFGRDEQQQKQNKNVKKKTQNDIPVCRDAPCAKCEGQIVRNDEKYVIKCSLNYHILW